jgi:hypothetical protein
VRYYRTHTDTRHLRTRSSLQRLKSPRTSVSIPSYTVSQISYSQLFSSPVSIYTTSALTHASVTNKCDSPKKAYSTPYQGHTHDCRNASPLPRYAPRRVRRLSAPVGVFFFFQQARVLAPNWDCARHEWIVRCLIPDGVSPARSNLPDSPSLRIPE